MERRKMDYLQWLPSIVTVLTFLIGAVIWFNTMSGIPPRVTKTEEKIIELEKAQATNDVKTDLTLKAVYEVRSILMDDKK